jgi:hypothetical protein
VVAAPNPDAQFLNRPVVTLVIDHNGAIVPPPGISVNLADRTDAGAFARSIVKVTNPDRFGIDTGAYFI